MSTETPEEFAGRDRLSPREQSFVLAYTRIGSATYGMSKESAIAAGFAESRAELTGSRFLKTPRILDAIAGIHQKLFDDFTASPARVMSDLENAKAMALAKNDRTSYIRLVELMGKSLCLWSEKSGPLDVEEPKELSAERKEQLELIQSLMNENLPAIVEYLRQKRDAKRESIHKQKIVETE